VIHISRFVGGDRTVHLSLEGTVDRVHVVALESAVAEARQLGWGPLVLHCAELQGADDEGVRFLKSLMHDGASFLELPVHLAWKLSQCDPPNG
jgi:hypothetical protein